MKKSWQPWLALAWRLTSTNVYTIPTKTWTVIFPKNFNEVFETISKKKKFYSLHAPENSLPHHDRTIINQLLWILLQTSKFYFRSISIIHRTMSLNFFYVTLIRKHTSGYRPRVDRYCKSKIWLLPICLIKLAVRYATPYYNACFLVCYRFVFCCSEVHVSIPSRRESTETQDCPRTSLIDGKIWIFTLSQAVFKSLRVSW